MELGAVGDTNGNYFFVIPLNIRVVLFISNVEEIRANNYLLIEPTGSNKVDNINKRFVILK